MGTPRVDPATVARVVELSATMTRQAVADAVGRTRNQVIGIICRYAPHLINPTNSTRKDAPVSWSPERVAELKRLARVPGITQTQMGAKMRVPVSRRAISMAIQRYAPELVGTFRRGGGFRLPATSGRNGLSDAQVVAKRAAARAAYVPPPAEAPTPTMVTLVDLRNGQCKWPLDGRGAETMFCGAERWVRGPYCHHHHGRAFVAARV